jgi:hypothetical protein
MGVRLASFTGRGQWNAAASFERGTVSFGPLEVFAPAGAAQVSATRTAQAVNEAERRREGMRRGTLTR